GTATATTGDDGKYFFTGATSGGGYTVTPSKNGYTFAPAQLTVTNLSGNATGDFTGSPVPTPTPTPVPPAPTPTPTPTPEPTPEPTPIPTPVPSPAPPPSIYIVAESASYAEPDVAAEITVRRAGDLSSAATVEYETADGTAREGYDYMAARGTLQFAAGESEKKVRVPLIEDAYEESDETFMLKLSNPTGGPQLGAASAVLFSIKGNPAPAAAGNPSDDARFFVRQHYLDFLGREPDAGGMNFWSNEITSCAGDAQCVEDKRQNVSAAFFLSIEFKETGYLVYRIYKAAYGDMAGAPVPLSREELLPDTQRIGRGVVVGAAGWAALLESNKAAFAQEFVSRTRFTSSYPQGTTPEQFVDALNTNAGNVLSADERAQLIELLTANNDDTGRVSVLRRVAEHAQLERAELNKAFVLMQYFGYLRRNPNEGPDTDFRGWEFWLGKLDDNGGNFVHAQMVKAFIDSIEYRRRFAP
ncbi:MAG: DUF4214 domain-containing protein, partial [Acidobacteria bacterium]|nr:DUF4214 domain-containing protein [Acidobacteriota bacterium]